MFDADTMTALLWVSVIAGYAWSVWSLDRLGRRADADHDAERRPAVADMRRNVVTHRGGAASVGEVFYPGRMTPRNCAQ
jgi:hypothetical protein